MTRAIAKTYKIIDNNLRAINYFFLIIAFAFVLVYIVNLFAVINRTVSIQKIEKKSLALQSLINNLDSKYLALSEDVEPDNLALYGMSKGQVSDYITVSNSIGLGFANDLLSNRNGF